MDRINANTGNKLVLATDCISIIFSYILVAQIRGGLLSPHFFSTMYGMLLIITVLAYIVLYEMLGKAKNILKRGMLEEIIAILKLQGGLLLVITSILYITKQPGISRLFLALFIVINSVLTFIIRINLRLALINYKKSKFSHKIMLITNEAWAEDLIRDIRKERYFSFVIDSLCVYDKNRMGSNFLGIDVVANKENLLQVIQKNVVDEVLIRFDEFLAEEVHELIRELEILGIVIHLDLKLDNTIQLNNKNISMIGGHYVATFSTRMFESSQVVLKRMMDIMGGLVGVIFTGVLTLVLGPLIKLESKGPVFFSQTRIGKNGRRFKIYKFRSMCNDAEAKKKELMSKNTMKGPISKIENDPRITRIGQFIRKTSLDEFPQFLNVLKGDMSLVGTRPPTEDEFQMYEMRHKKRLSFQPGLTGLWQVSGRSNIEDFEDVMKFDLEYIDTWSVGLDIKVIVKTLKVVVLGKGAK